MLERWNDKIFNACVELLHDVPSRVLPGMSMTDLRKLIKKHEAEGKKMEKLPS